MSNYVNKVVATRSFVNAIKKLKKDHKKKELQEIHDVVTQLKQFNISTQKDNHPLHNAEGHKDIHISGGDLVLIYKYISNPGENTVLVIDLRLQDVVDHDDLSSYDTKKYKAPASDFDPDSILSSTSFFKWYDALPEESQWVVDDIADSEGIPFYDQASDEELAYLKDRYESIHACQNSVYSSEESEELVEDELETSEQEFSSKDTSINSSKLPAIYKLVNFPKGSVVLDFGGGRYDNGVEYLNSIGCEGYVYDPYNRTSEHNSAVVKAIRSNGGADIVLNSNVLNVIKEAAARRTVLKNIKKLVKPSGKVYITVYEGNGSGQGKQSKADSFQLNRKTADYLEEIQEVFPDATRKGKLIIATPNGAPVKSSTNTNIPVSDLNKLMMRAADIHDRRELIGLLGDLASIDQKMYHHYCDLDQSGEYSPAAIGKMISDDLYWKLEDNANSSLRSQIFDFLDELGGYSDYNQKIQDVSEEFKMSPDEAEGYVAEWAHGLQYDEWHDIADLEDIESKDIIESGKLVEPPQHVVDDLLNILSNFGFELDERFEVNPGRTWMGNIHIQVIDPNSYVEDSDNLRNYVSREMINKIDNLSNSSNCPITWNFGVDENGNVTGGLTIDKQWIEGSSTIESSDFVFDPTVKEEDINLPGYAVQWVTGYVGNGLNSTDRKYFRTEKERDEFIKKLESNNAIGIETWKIDNFYHTYPGEDDSSVTSASYGGAYDIDDDQFFTNEELYEFAYEIEEKFNSIASNGPWTFYETYLTPSENNLYEIGLTNNDVELDAKLNIDMRRIREPSDIHKYTDEILNQLIYHYNQYYEPVESSTCMDKEKTVESSDDLSKEPLSSQIIDYLDDCGGYVDYNQNVESVAEEFGLSLDEAENYVSRWAHGWYDAWKDTADQYEDQYIEESTDVNSSIAPYKRSEFVKQLQDELYNKASEVMQSYEFGFPLEEIADYLVVEVTDNSDAIVAQVRAELTYRGMDTLANALNPIVEKYDKNAYFDHVEPGIIESYIFSDAVFSKTDVNSAEYIDYENPVDAEKIYQVEFDNTVTLEDNIMSFKEGEIFDNIEDEDYNGIEVDDADGVSEKILDLITYNVPEEDGTYRVSGIANLKYFIGNIYEGYSDPDFDDTLPGNFYDVSNIDISYDPRGSWVENLQVEKI